MSYEKKTWVNNQTKLSAGNMNHLEAGIEEAIASAAAANDLANAVKSAAESAKSVADKAAANAEAALTAAESVRAIALTAEGEAAAAALDAKDAKAVAGEAKESVAAAEAEIAKKQDALVSGDSIKTINGESLLGKGDIVVNVDVDANYNELDSASLDELSERGVYKIASATDVPSETSASGTLHVNELDDDHYEQLWYSDSN